MNQPKKIKHRKPADERRVILRSIRFTKSEEQTIDRAARQSGLDFASYVRSCALTAAKKDPA